MKQENSYQHLQQNPHIEQGVLHLPLFSLLLPRVHLFIVFVPGINRHLIVGWILHLPCLNTQERVSLVQLISRTILSKNFPPSFLLLVQRDISCIGKWLQVLGDEYFALFFFLFVFSLDILDGDFHSQSLPLPILYFELSVHYVCFVSVRSLFSLLLYFTSFFLFVE